MSDKFTLSIKHLYAVDFHEAAIAIAEGQECYVLRAPIDSGNMMEPILRELIRLANVGWNHELYLRQHTDDGPDMRAWMDKVREVGLASKRREVWHFREPETFHIACRSDNPNEGITTIAANVTCMECLGWLAAMQVEQNLIGKQIKVDDVPAADPFRGSVFSDPDAGKVPAPVDNPFLKYADKVGR